MSRNRLFITLLFAAVLFVSVKVWAQDNSLEFERISIDEGLSQSTVLCIHQDSRDFLWFGTYDGLNRYDGYRFKVYKNDPHNPSSISDNHIECITEDSLGRLWIGTQQGISVYDRRKDKFTIYRHQPDDPSSLNNDFVRYILIDKKGVVWVGTFGGGLSKFDEKSGKFIQYKNDPANLNSISHNTVLCIYEDHLDNLWVGTDGGLNLLDRKTGNFTRFIHDPANPASLSHDGVWRIYEDKAGHLWIGTWGGGLNYYDREKKTFRTFKYNPANPASLSNDIVRSIYEDKSGYLWIGTETGGLNRIRTADLLQKNPVFSHYFSNNENPAGLTSNSIVSLFEDKSGIIWLGTNFGGINKYNPGKRKFSLFQKKANQSGGLNSNAILGMYEDHQGILWIGTNGGGLNRFDRKKNQFSYFTYNPNDPKSLSNNVVRSICEDKFNRLWVCTDQGINRYDPNTGHFKRYYQDNNDPGSISHNTGWTIMRSMDGNLWIGTVNGLNRYNYESDSFTQYMHDENDPMSISDNFIWDIFQTDSSALWIGTNSGGLNLLNLANGQFSHYRHNPQDFNTLSDNKVLSIFGSEKEVLWLGTPNGLNRLEVASGRAELFSTEQGLPSSVIQCMLPDANGNLWLGTNKGLTRFNPKTGQVKTYQKSSGLQSNEFSVNACAVLNSGEMAFGGINGFNIFYPDSIRDDPNVPNIVLTNLQIMNRSVSAGDTINGQVILHQEISESQQLSFSYKQSVISFEFAALHYASPMENLYAYKLEPFDQEWFFTSADRRYITYTNLPGDDYILRIKASNNDKVWNDEGIAVQITVTPPFWKTSWFIILMIVLFLGSVYLFFRWRIRSIERHRKELEKQVEERTHELKDANDEILNKAAELEKSNKNLAVAKKETDNILQNVNEGFFILNSKHELSSQYSAVLETILAQKKLGHRNFLELLESKISKSMLENTKRFLDILFKDDISESMVADLNPLIDQPFTFRSGKDTVIKYLNFSFRKIKSGRSKKIELIVTVRDVTSQILLSQKLHQEEARREKLMQLILSIIDVEPEMLDDFKESARREMDFIDQIMNHSHIDDFQAMLVKAFRSMHLIKGNARLLNIEFFGEMSHQFEDMISELQKKEILTDEDIEPLRIRLQEMREGLDEMESVIERIAKVNTHKDASGQHARQNLMQSLANLISDFSRDLGKKIDFKNKDFKAEMIPAKYRLLVKEVLIQLIRNSIAHGIEMPDERNRAKKPERGTIEINTISENGRIGFRIKDDGRGLQIDKLKQKALESGKWQIDDLQSWDEEKLTQLIFAPGLSTSNKADMISGRGMGMDGVKHRIEEHNGRILVHSRPGEYCEFEILLPAV